MGLHPGLAGFKPVPVCGPSADLTPLLLPRHIENWRGLHTLNAVDMELYTGLQKL